MSSISVSSLAKSPFKFPEAVLVSRGGKYYGEVEFKLDTRTPSYVKMKTRFMSRLFGEFSPSAGDLGYWLGGVDVQCWTSSTPRESAQRSWQWVAASGRSPARCLPITS